MKFTEVKENLNELKVKLKAKFSTLTEDDLHFEKSRSQDLLRRVEYKLRKTPKELQEIIENL